MGRRSNHESPPGSRARRAGRRTSQSEKHPAQPAQRDAAHRPVLRFVLIFAALVIPFNVFYYAYFAKGATFNAYLRLNASASAAIIRAFGTPAAAHGKVLTSSRGASLSIAQGCDAIQPAALFAFAVLASPLRFKRKLPGLLLGTGLLLVLNLVRVLTLFYTQIHFPRAFQFMHIEFWQTLFIILALLFWVIWAVRAQRREAAHA